MVDFEYMCYTVISAWLADSYVHYAACGQFVNHFQRTKQD